MSEGFLIGRLIRDADGHAVDFAIMEVNPAWEKLTGLNRERLAGRRISEIAPADEPAWLRHISGVLSSDEVASFEEYSPSVDKWLKVYAFPLNMEDVFAVVIIDTTERRRAEQALRKSEAFLNNVFESIQDGISVLDKDLNIVRTNHVMGEWYPHMLPLEGKKCYYAYHGRSVPCEICPSTKAIRHKTMQCEIVPLHGENETEKGWLEIYSFPLLDENGNVTGVIEHVRDITRRKGDEEALIESEARFRALFENAGAAIFVIEAENGAIVDCNSNAEKLIGRSRDEIMQMTVLDLHPQDDCEKHRSDIMRLAARGQIINYETEALHKDGRRIPVIVNATPIVINGRKIMMGFFLDITERKLAEEALQRSEAFLNNVFESIQDGISVLDKDLNIVRTNHVMQDWHRYVLPLEGKKCYYAYHDRSEPCDICPSLRAIKQKAMQCEIVPFHGENKVERGWLEIFSFPLLDAEGNVTGVIEHVRDITVRKRAEEALRESEEKFRAVAETASVAICILQDGRFQYVNPAMEAISGYTKEELASIDFTAMVHLEAQPRIKAQYGLWLAGASLEGRSEIKGVSRNGEVIWADVSRKTISYRGRPAVLLTGVDITERKRMEEALHHSEERYRLLTENSPDFIYIIDREFRVMFVNRAGATVLERHPEDVIGQDLSRLFPPDTLSGMKESLSRVFETGKPYSSEFVHRFYQSDYYMHVALTPVFDGQGNVSCVMGVSRDINGLKKAEAELREAKEQAELYVDLMGHDINNMHQMALGYLEIARDAQSDEVLKALLDKPIEALQRSALLIRNVRKLQRLREGRMSAQTIDLCAMLADLGKEYEALPGSTVTINLNGHKGCYVRADELLYDVFANLVGNGIKHTDGNAGISVSLDTRTEGDRRCYAVSVEDNGPGIPDDFKDLIFKRLLKGTSNAKGSGIGLYLVKSLVNSYGGKVWAEDRVPGDHTKGAKFVVMLPAVEQ